MRRQCFYVLRFLSTNPIIGVVIDAINARRGEKRSMCHSRIYLQWIYRSADVALRFLTHSTPLMSINSRGHAVYIRWYALFLILSFIILLFLEIFSGGHSSTTLFYFVQDNNLPKKFRFFEQVDNNMTINFSFYDN